MDRYPSTLIRKEQNGPRYFGSTKYPFIDFSTEDYYIITMQGDRLDNLAAQFYGDPTLYWILQIANPNCKKDSLYPPIGIQLRIPQNTTKILDDFDTLNEE
jgi:hypothetical protein